MRRLALLPRLDAAVGGDGVDDAGVGGDGVDGVVVGADGLEALEVSDAPDLERAVPGARVEQRGVVHHGGNGEAGDAVGVLDPEATVAAPRHCLHIAGLAEHLAQVPTDWRRRWWRSLHHTESRTQEWGLGVQVWTGT